MLYRLLATHIKNTRITPVATYLAYKSSGYADTGPISGITISDFVSVWTPYNTGGPSGAPGAGRKGRKNEGGEGKAGAQGQAVRGKLEERKSAEQLGIKERAGAVKRVVAEDLKVGVTLGGTREGTGMAVLEREGRESRWVYRLSWFWFCCGREQMLTVTDLRDRVFILRIGGGIFVGSWAVRRVRCR